MMPESSPTPIPALILVVGDEELLVTRAIEQISLAAIKADPDADVREYQASEVEAAEIYEALSPSLFGGRRVVVFRSAQDIRVALLDALKPFLAAPSDDVTIVLQHLGGAKGKALLDAAKKAGASTITCAKLTKPGERLDFIKAEVRRAGGSIAPDAAQLLVDAVGTDLRELAAVSAQLVSDSGGRIDTDMVSRYHQGRAEVKGFEISDKVVTGDSTGALESLRWALADGVPHVVIADALAQGVEAVARVAAAGRGNQYDLAQKLGMPPWKVNRVQGQVRGWSEAGLREALGLVASLNADVKGAAADPNYAIERTIRHVTAARGSR
nr:DNA polymerase III subunit delta [Jatrophihabitans sp. GAS493]